MFPKWVEPGHRPLKCQQVPSKANSKGPRTQIVGFYGPNSIIFNGIWDLKPYYLGPWTLRDRCGNATFPVGRHMDM